MDANTEEINKRWMLNKDVVHFLPMFLPRDEDKTGQEGALRTTIFQVLILAFSYIQKQYFCLIEGCIRETEGGREGTKRGKLFVKVL